MSRWINLQWDKFSVAFDHFVVLNVVLVELEDSVGIFSKLVPSVQKPAIERAISEYFDKVGEDMLEDVLLGEMLAIFACILLNLFLGLNDTRK